MKNDVFSSPRTKKPFSFKPKFIKKNNENSQHLNLISKKMKEEEKIQENIDLKLQNKKLPNKKQRNQKNNNLTNSKSKNQKIKNKENKHKKIILNLNEESEKKIFKKKRPESNKKKELNLNILSNKKIKENLSESFHSTKQIKPIHIKKDFYVKTVSANLISEKNISQSNSIFESSFSSSSSSKSIGKGSLKFNERRKKYLLNKYNKDNNHSSLYNKDNNISSCNYDNVLSELNTISSELNQLNNIKK